MDRLQPVVGHTDVNAESDGAGRDARTVALGTALVVCLAGFLVTLDLTGTQAIVGVSMAVLATVVALIGMASSTDRVESLPLWVASGCYLGVASTALTDQAIPLLAAAVACQVWVVLSAWRFEVSVISWLSVISCVVCFVAVTGLLTAMPNDFEPIRVTADDSMTAVSEGE